MLLFRSVRIFSLVTLTNSILSTETDIYIQYTSLNPVEPKMVKNLPTFKFFLG